MRRIIAALSAALLSLAAADTFGRGDLAARAQRMEPPIHGHAESDFAMSQKEYKPETGRYDRWRASSGKGEYDLVAPEFWRNVWIRQVRVGRTELKTGSLEELDFDGEGVVEVFFVPIRTGRRIAA